MINHNSVSSNLPFVVHSHKELMDAFDKLPSKIRLRICRTISNLSSVEILEALEDGMTEDECLKTIEYTDELDKSY